MRWIAGPLYSFQGILLSSPTCFSKTNKSLRTTKDWQPPVNDLNTDRYHTAEPVISFYRISLAN